VDSGAVRQGQEQPGRAVADVDAVSPAQPRATTTAMVVQSDMSRDDVILAFETSLRDGGWPVEWATAVGEDNLEIAAQLPVGSIITRELDNFFLRGALLR
jgi:hypothetical protein